MATSSHRQFATEALGCFDLEPRFEFLLTAEDVQNVKPAPDVYLKAAAQLGIKPASTKRNLAKAVYHCKTTETRFATVTFGSDA